MCRVDDLVRQLLCTYEMMHDVMIDDRGSTQSAVAGDGIRDKTVMSRDRAES